MRKLILFVSLFCLISIPTFAKDFSFVACTADKFTATLAISIDDEALRANAGIATTVKQAFTDTANALPARALVDEEGYDMFLTKLDYDARMAITVTGPPYISTESCK